MDISDLKSLLTRVADGDLSVKEALSQAGAMEDDLGFARVDLDRKARCGTPEVIYCPGKTPQQVAGVVSSLEAAGQDVLATRATSDVYDAVLRVAPEAHYDANARLITLQKHSPEGTGSICVICAGTSDIPVAEEAAVTAEFMGGNVTRIFDVGVAGLHRLTRRLPDMEHANVVIAVAGMEGALPSVAGGLLRCPVIAVPTSVGYGTSFNGLTALLAMLNSCASGVTVVNIDNGFGAAVAATLINRKCIPLSDE